MNAKSKLERQDRRIVKRARKTQSKPVTLLGTASEIADQPPLYAISALVGVVGLLRRDRGMVRAGARMLAAEWTATRIKSVVKHNIDRGRPMAGPSAKAKRAKAGAAASNSFPSGHTAGAAAVSRALARSYPRAAGPAYAAATAIGVIQVPRGKHYASDVLAGAIIGLIADACVASVERGLFALGSKWRVSGTISPKESLLPRAREMLSDRVDAGGNPGAVHHQHHGED